MKKIHYGRTTNREWAVPVLPVVVIATLLLLASTFWLAWSMSRDLTLFRVSKNLNTTMSIYCTTSNPQELRGYADHRLDKLMDYKNVGDGLWCSNGDAFALKLELAFERKACKIVTDALMKDLTGVLK